MGLKDLNIKVSYDSGCDDILTDFYIPALREAKTYYRISGFFSSSSLAVAARGIEGLIHNQGTMKMIISPKLSEQDAQMIELAKESPETVLERSMQFELDNLETAIREDCVAAFGWLLAKNLLEIKMAIVYDENGHVLDYEKANSRGIFHIKVGIVEDSKGNLLSFSGSVNETASGWQNNVEEFKVFKNWIPGQDEYCQSDLEKFQSYWTEERQNIKFVNLPTVIKDSIIEKGSLKYNFESNPEVNTYIEEEKMEYIPFSLFDFQQQAVDKWLKNDHRLICEMATGTGKTRTAIACMSVALKSDEPIIVIVATPQNTLSRQWKIQVEELNVKFDTSLIADGTVPKWSNKLEGYLLDLALEDISSLIIYTTFNTLSSKRFITTILENLNGTRVFVIGDEMHGLGSKKFSQGLLDCYDYRLGLSATPSRWFDESGTQKIMDYFGNETFEFTIKDALTTINPITNQYYLTDYYYIPIFVTLTENEVEEYEKLTTKIVKKLIYSSDEEEKSEELEQLLFKRAGIHKSAVNKHIAFEEILDSLGKDLDNTLIFVSDKQINTVLSTLSERKIIANRITETEGTKEKKEYNGISERQYIINNFKTGVYQVLVAIKCLDEGIDIPEADTAIILSSSTNPREYIQRIGRVIRTYPGKEYARIFDVIVKPNDKFCSAEQRELEIKIFEKEMERVKEIAGNAVNSISVLLEINKMMGEVLK